MSNFDPSTPQRQPEPQARPALPVIAIFVALWLVGCAFAFALMMGWF